MITKYNGSSWVSAPVKKYNGSSWDFADVRHYDGSDWLYLNPVIYDEDLTNGLVSYYSFDDNANDIYGSNDGTVVGATHTSSGKVNGAYDFDGSNDYIDINIAFNLQDDISMSFWIKTTQTSFFKFGNFEAPEYFIIRFNEVSNGDFGLYRENSDNVSKQEFSITDPYDFTDGKWHHFAIYWTDNSFSENKIWIDGVEQAITQDLWDTMNSYTMPTFVIGAQSNWDGDFQNFFNGTLDELGIWDREITSAEVSKLYNYGVGRHGNDWLYLNSVIYDEDLTNGLISYYSFDDNANDIYGSNDGTVVGATHTSSGKVNGAYDFDGSNDYIGLPLFSSGLTSKTTTHSFWVKLDDKSANHLGFINYHASSSGNSFFRFDAIDQSTTTNFKFEAYAGSGDSASTGRSRATTDNNFDYGEWIHVVFVYDYSKTTSLWSVYVNGVNQALTYSYNQKPSTMQPITSITIGAAAMTGTETPSYFVDGLIDEVGIWDRELTSAEVSKLYNNGEGKHGG